MSTRGDLACWSPLFAVIVKRKQEADAEEVFIAELLAPVM
jgi:hypothetical protein